MGQIVFYLVKGKLILFSFSSIFLAFNRSKEDVPPWLRIQQNVWPVVGKQSKFSDALRAGLGIHSSLICSDQMSDYERVAQIAQDK